MLSPKKKEKRGSFFFAISDGTSKRLSEEKEQQQKIVALSVLSSRSEFKRTGKAVGVMLKPFKISPSPFLWRRRIKTTRLLEQSITVSKFLFCFGLEA